MANYLDNKRIFITGVCGTIASKILEILTHGGSYHPAEIVGVDNNESGLFFLSEEYNSDPRVSFLLGDVRDASRIETLMKGIDVVFHTAAFKHVILSEISPFDAVQTNILGVENVIKAAYRRNVELVLFTSSDKAVNPTNVMGTSKLMGERLITAANNAVRGKGPLFYSTRFGNVLGSRGSVIPIFRDQIMKGGPVTVTDPGMTRFIMTIEEAARLVIETTEFAVGGEVIVTKMPAIAITDLADVMIDALAPAYGRKPEEIERKVIGKKPGEKLYEELMSQEEVGRALELDRYFVVLPAFRGIYRKFEYGYKGVLRHDLNRPYISVSEEKLSKDHLRMLLKKNDLLA